MISLRYAHYVAITLGIALIPTIIHSYLALTLADGRQVRNIDPEFSSYSSRPTKRQPNWGEVTFSCFDWLERIYLDSNGHQVRLFVGRSYDHKSLYHHPELALSYGEDFKLKQRVQLSGSPGIPVILLRKQTRPGIAAYALLYEDQFIEHPISHQIKHSLNQLLNPRKPLTLFYVSQPNVDRAIAFNETASAQVLRYAIEAFRKDVAVVVDD